MHKNPTWFTKNRYRGWRKFASSLCKIDGGVQNDKIDACERSSVINPITNALLW